MYYRRSFRIPLRGMQTVLAKATERKNPLPEWARDFWRTMADSEPDFAAGGGEVTDGYALSPLVPHTASRNADGSRHAIIRKEDLPLGAGLLWRTMADLNRRHQASEACALSI